MKLTNEKINLENGLKREWIITNGIGGFASSTVIGANTRKYHGLLIAPLTPPARRYLILSKLDEAIEIENQKYELFTNIGENYISQGYQYLESFEKDFLPIFTYKIEDITIKKIICMEEQKNSVCIHYKINSPKNNIKLTLAPVMNFRDFHTMNTNHEFNLKQEKKDRKVKIIIDGNSETPIYTYVSEGNYIEHIQDAFRNMYYIEEEKRGFFPEENHCVPGRYEIEIEAGKEKEITFICSLEENIEEIQAKEVINHELKRLNKLIQKTDLLETARNKLPEQFIKDFVIATDNFVVYRPSFRLHTLIAGYPWFLDWGRDALISMEGLLLVTKRFDIAKEVLQTMTRDVKFGLVPNRLFWI